MRKRTTLAVAMLAVGAALTSPGIVWAGTNLVGATPTTTQASTTPSTVPSAPTSTAPTPAHAARAAISCEAATGRVTAALGVGAGRLAPNRPLVAQFTTSTGYLRVGATKVQTPAWTTTTVPFTTASDGSAIVTGYQHDWNPALYRGYSESIRVTVRSATNNGIVLEGLTATCTHGWTGAVAVDCDPQNGTLTARVEATGLAQVAPDDQHVVTYTRTLNYRLDDGNGFEMTTNPVTVRMPAPTDGYSTAPLYSETPNRDRFSSYRERIQYRVLHRNYGGSVYYTVAEGEVACRVIG